MQRHWCSVEKTWFDFDGVCDMCEMTEEQAVQQMKETSDAQFKDLMRRVEAAARPDINDA